MSYVSRGELRRAYEDCIKRKRKTCNAIDFETDDNVKLENLYRELNTLTYTIGKSITFVLTKDDGTPYREVFAGDFRDRIVHHLLVNRLISSFEKYWLKQDNYACRKGKGVLYGVKRCYEQMQQAIQSTDEVVYAFKGDFRNCFNSVNKLKMYKLIESFIIEHFPNDKNLIFNLYLLKAIIMHRPQKEGNYIRKQAKELYDRLPYEKSMFNLDDDHGIAIGNLTSQLFLNFFYGLFDKYVTEVLGYKFYGRYVDDFFVFFTDKLKFLEDYQKLKEFVITQLDACLSPKKFYLQECNKGVCFIGYIVYPDRIYVKNTTKTKFYKMLYDMNKVVKNRGYIISNILADRMMPSWNSYIGIFSHVNARNIILKGINKYPLLIESMKQKFDFDRDYFIHKKKETKLLHAKTNKVEKN